MAGSAASGLLSRQLKQMQTDKDIPGISCGLVGNNIFEWEVMLMISDDCKYYGGTPSPAHIALTSHSLPSHTVRMLTNGIYIQEDSTAPTSPSHPNTPIYHQK